MSNNLQIANTIVQQLGGMGRLKMMTGAKNFVAGDNSVQFKIGRNSNRVNIVRVKLNGLDLYDMEFGWGTKNGYTVKTEYKDVYNDQLPSLFEQATGMYLSI